MGSSKKQTNSTSPAEWILGQVTRKWGNMRRAAALSLAVCMTVSLMPGSTWADTGDGEKTVVITEFKPLADRIAEQEVPFGTLESELGLPSKLKAMGYEQGTGDENDPPVATDSNGRAEDDTDTTPHAITVTGVAWEADEAYDETAAGETFTFTAVLPERYILEEAELPEILVTLSDQAEDSTETVNTDEGQKKATDSNADPIEFAITKQPHDVYALVGQEVPFKVEATGEDIIYQWQKGVPGPEADGTFDRDSAAEEAFTWSDIDGAGEAVYRFCVEEEDFTGNMYRCLLSCGEEELTTDAAKVKKMMLRADNGKVQIIKSDGTEGQKYEKLQDAIDAAVSGNDDDSDTIRILDDIDLDVLEPADVSINGKNLTLDLGDKNIQYSGDSGAIKLEGDASLTVVGTTGTISSTKFQGIAIKNRGGGSVSVEGGTLSATGDQGRAITNEGTGSVSVKGGTLSATGSQGRAITNTGTGSVSVKEGTLSATGASGHAITNTGTGSVSVKGGTLSATGTQGCAIWNMIAGDVIVEGGTLSATGDMGNAIHNGAKGNVTVEGGTVSATGGTGSAIYNSGTGKITIGKNAVISSDVVPNSRKEGTITLEVDPTGTSETVLEIKGGTVENTSENTAGCYAVSFLNGVTVDNLNVYYQKTGGTVNGKIYPEAAVRITDSTGAEVKGYAAFLQDAIDAAGPGDGSGGDILQLLDDIDLEPAGVSINGKNLTLDLGAKDITYSGGGGGSDAIKLGDNASLTVVGTGTISVTGIGRIAINNTGKGTVSVKGVTISVMGGNSRAIDNAGEGNVSIEAGTTVSATKDSGKAIINEGAGNVSIEAGNVSSTGENGRAIINAGTGSVSVKGGTVSATGLLSNAIDNQKEGNVTVEGGTVSASGGTGKAIYNSGTGKITIEKNAVISSDVDPMFMNEGTITLSANFTGTSKTVLEIKGGTVENTAENTAGGYAVSFLYGVTVDHLNEYYKKTGGTVNGKIYPEAAVQITDSTGREVKRYAAFLQAAIDAAGPGDGSGGDILQLLDNIVLKPAGESTIVSIDGKNLTLDLNGKNITYNEMDGRPAISLLSGSLNVTDRVGNGKILTTKRDGIAIWNKGGNVSITGGTVSGGESCRAIANDGTVSVTGGTVSAEDFIAIENYGTVSVTGGTVSARGSSGIAICNVGRGKITIGGSAKVTNASTTENGSTICLYEVPAGADKTVLEITGGTVENTAGRYAIYFRDGIGVTSENVRDYYKAANGTVIGKIHPEPLPEPETYMATVTLNRDGIVWADHNKTVKLKEAGGTAEYANGALVPNGTYRILVDEVDTNQTLTVNGIAVDARIDYYTVTFYDGTEEYGSETAQKPQTVLKNGKAVKPATDPAKTGFSFVKWVTAAGGTAEYDFENTAVTQETKVYASWTSTGQTGGQDNPGDTPSGGGNDPNPPSGGGTGDTPSGGGNDSDPSSGGGTGSDTGTTSKNTSTVTNTVTAEDGGSVTTTTTTSSDSSGKQTTVTTRVTRDAAGNVTGSTATAAAGNIQTEAGEGVSQVTVRPDGSAINSAAAAAGATAEHPLKVQVEVPDTAAGELAKPEIQSVAVNVIIPAAAAGNPDVEIGVIIGRETIQAAKDTGKNVAVTVMNENGSVEAVWSLNGSAMRAMGGGTGDVSLGLRMAPVKSEDPLAQPVKPLAAARGNENGLVLSIGGSGKLTAPVKLTVPATNRTEIKAGDQVALYLHDPAAGTLVPAPGSSYPVDANGNVTIDLPAMEFAAGADRYVLLPVLAAGAVPAALPASAGASMPYEIKRGDTLNKIARQYGCSVQELLNLNHIPDVTDLRIGQVIQLPAR